MTNLIKSFLQETTRSEITKSFHIPVRINFSEAKHTTLYEAQIQYLSELVLSGSEAIRIHGTICKACGFDFEKLYGRRGYKYIEVHHLVPLSKVKGGVIVNPTYDMTVLCSNCHRMIHRLMRDILSMDQLVELIHEQKSKT